MQSAALGFMLAQAHFADPLVAVPSAVSVVCMVRRPRRPLYPIPHPSAPMHRSSPSLVCGIPVSQVLRHGRGAHSPLLHLHGDRKVGLLCEPAAQMNSNSLHIFHMKYIF